jgi:hypothetical protein
LVGSNEMMAVSSFRIRRTTIILLRNGIVIFIFDSILLLLILLLIYVVINVVIDVDKSYDSDDVDGNDIIRRLF